MPVLVKKGAACKSNYCCSENSRCRDKHATQRLENLDVPRKQGMVLLDELISKISTFVGAISKLPPNSKAILNKKIAEITKNGVFDMLTQPTLGVHGRHAAGFS
jgi:hypothetical protein